MDRLIFPNLKHFAHKKKIDKPKKFSIYITLCILYMNVICLIFMPFFSIKNNNL